MAMSQVLQCLLCREARHLAHNDGYLVIAFGELDECFCRCHRIGRSTNCCWACDISASTSSLCLERRSWRYDSWHLIGGTCVTSFALIRCSQQPSDQPDERSPQMMLHQKLIAVYWPVRLFLRDSLIVSTCYEARYLAHRFVMSS